MLYKGLLDHSIPDISSSIYLLVSIYQLEDSYSVVQTQILKKAIKLVAKATGFSSKLSIILRTLQKSVR